MKTGIYFISNKTTGKVYVGSSVDIDTRINAHFASLRNGVHINKKLQKDFKELGEECFTYEVAVICGEDELIQLENYFIDNLKSKYNKGKAHLGRHGNQRKRENPKKPYNMVVDGSLLENIKKVSEDQHRSVNNTIEVALIEYVDKHKKKK